MSKVFKIIIVIVLIAAVGIVVALKQKEKGAESKSITATVSEPAASVEIQQAEKTAEFNNAPLVMTVKVVEKLPRLVDLGADKCIPCKMMKPILEELSAEYKDKLQVVFIDVWKNPQEGSKYNIRVIPTQIFFDPDGKELFRHEGFFSKESILTKWKELGFEIKKKD